jgi:hypothetical protein
MFNNKIARRTCIIQMRKRRILKRMKEQNSVRKAGGGLYTIKG